MLEIFNPANALGALQTFLDTGGQVLVAIMVLTFVMWALIVERLIYFGFSQSSALKSAQRNWGARTDRNSWYALAVREKLVSEIKQEANRNMVLIKGMVAVAPLLGLLGSVTGMVEVFNVMAVTGSSNARLMAGGISKATIPTMAGLVTSLFGILMINVIERSATKAVVQVSDDLVIE